MCKIALVCSALCTLLAVPSCRKKQHQAPVSRKVTVESKYDATKEFVDEDYRFRLTWPGSGWKLLRRKDANKVVPDAAAGLMSAGIWGVVIVESHPGAQLKASARLILNNTEMTDKIEEKFVQIKYRGKDAIRFLLRGKRSGIAIRYCATVFIHQDHIYQVVAVGILKKAAKVSAFSPVFDAFGLLPGKVRVRDIRHSTADTEGVGWRVKDGSFESAVFGLSVRPPKLWRVAVGDELASIHSDAEVGMVTRNPEIRVVLVPERCKGVSQNAFVKSMRQHFLNAGELVRRPGFLTLRAADRTLKMARFKTRATAPFEHLHGVIFQGDICLQIMAWYPMSQHQAAAARLAPALGAIGWLGKPQLRTLTEQLAKVPDPQDVVDASFSLRHGVYRNFHYGLIWKKPQGYWRAKLGAAATAYDPAALVVLEAPNHGIYARLIAERAQPKTTGQAHHNRVVKNVMKRLKAPRVTKSAAMNFSGIPGTVSVVNGAVDGIRFRYQVATTVRSGLALVVVVWGYEENMKRAAMAVNQVIAGVSVPGTALRPVEDTSNEYRDHRFGFSVRLPKSEWSHKESTPPQIRSAGTILGWTKGATHVMAIVMNAMGAGQDEAWFTGLLEQLIQDKFSGGTKDKPQRSEAIICQRKGRRLTWTRALERMDAFVVLRGRTFFVFMVHSPDLTGATADRLLKKFSLLD